MWLSIIMPVYNSASTIERSIKSVIKQNRSDVELIIMDAGSTDGTLDIIERYSSDIAVIHSSPDEGYADALNRGREYSTGECVMMLAADDVILDGALSKVKESMRAETDVWSGCQVDKVELGYIMDRSSSDLSRLNRGCSLKHPSTIFRKSVLDEIGGYNINYKCNADWDLFLRLYEKDANFQVEDIPVVLFDASGMSNSNFELLSKENAMIAMQHGFDDEVTKELVNIDYYKSRYEVIKKLLYKLGLLPLLYKLIGVEDACLSRNRCQNLLGEYFE